jgi:hypothetical protein
MPNNSAQFSVTVERFRKKTEAGRLIFVTISLKMGLLFPVRYLKPKGMDPPFPERVEKSLSLVSLIQRPMG